ncbi:MAG TPA: hypothetical protein VHB25_12160 [Gemmatimonadaceae bacterium]|nr:hypothetical protein [Gemmatimonadaceae bacterium]
MPDADVRREHESNPARTPLSLVPTFPPYVGAESYAVYRHESTRAMRLWVTYAFSDLAIPPSDEDEAIIVAASLAREEISRVLMPTELRLLGEAVRDILTARAIEAAVQREDRIRRDEWLREQQEGSGGQPE